MAAVSKSIVTLRILGDDLDPDEVTAVLGKAPTKAERKGEVVRSATTGSERIAKGGSWRLKARDRTPEDLDGQVAEILSGMTDDLERWKTLGARYRIDLFCGLFMLESNEGVSFSPATLVMLGARGIEMGLDIYAPTQVTTR